MKKKYSLKFSISFQVVKFISYVLKTFVSTLCYNNDENCDIFKLLIFFVIEDVNGLNVVFTILHKRNGFSKLIKKMVIYCKIGVLNQCL
jgi:hypothetical protein